MIQMFWTIRFLSFCAFCANICELQCCSGWKRSVIRKARKTGLNPIQCVLFQIMHGNKLKSNIAHFLQRISSIIVRISFLTCWHFDQFYSRLFLCVRVFNKHRYVQCMHQECNGVRRMRWQNRDMMMIENWLLYIQGPIPLCNSNNNEEREKKCSDLVAGWLFQDNFTI